MQNNKPGLSAYFVPGLMVAIMLITLPATIAFAQRVFPANMIRQITLVGATEVAFMCWHLAALKAARGDRQHNVAQFMTWLSLFGAVAMAISEIAFEYVDAGIMTKLDWLAPVSLIVLAILIAAHLGAGVLFASWNPTNVQRRADDRAQAAIDAETARLLEDQAPKVASLIASQRVAAQLDLMRAQHSVAAAGDETATRLLRQSLPQLAQPVAPPVVMAKDADDVTTPQDGGHPLA
jgi:hypothetical protein